MRLRHLPLLSVHIEQVPFQIGEPRQSICVELLREDCAGKARLKFTGVQNLKIERIHPGTICDLEVISVGDDQLEGLRFQVFNNEQDFTLNFLCFDFEMNELALEA